MYLLYLLRKHFIRLRHLKQVARHRHVKAYAVLTSTSEYQIENRVERYVPLLNRNNVQINEPRQRVLIHRVDVRQVRNREEQNARVFGNRPITLTRLVNLLLCILSNLISIATCDGEVDSQTNAGIESRHA